ncbi:MAG: PAS domain S-box protein [Chloroflexota bacterium]
MQIKRRQVRKIPRWSEQTYERLINSLGGIVWEADARTFRITFVNEETERVLGFSVDQWLNDPNLWREHVHPADADRTLSLEAIVASGQEQQTFEYRLIAGDGHIVWVQDIVTLIKENGVPTRLRGVMMDITERKRFQEAQRLTEERFRSLFEQSPIAIQTFQPNGDAIQANQAFLDLFRLTEQVAYPYNLLKDSRIMQREGADALRKAFGGEATRVPLMYFDAVAFGERQMGRGRWIESFAYPIKDELDDVREVVLVVEDVTERKEAEERARMQEEQYRAVFEATTDGLTINDLDGNLVAVNPAFASMHGYTVEEMQDIDPRTFIHPDDHAQVPLAFAAFRAGKEYHETLGRDVRKDGSVFPIELHGTRFIYRGEPHILCIVRDITERVDSEEQLKLKEEQYRAIFEATSDGLVISDLGGNVLEVNPAFAAMEGYTREELVGMDPRKWVHPDSHANLAEYLEKVSRGERFRVEGLQIRKDGTVFPAEVHEAPFIYNGRRHTLAIIRDITERVQARELLEQRVEERTRELSTLLEVSRNVTSTLELKPLLARILEQLKLVADYNRARITVGGKGEVSVSSAWGNDDDSAHGEPGAEEPIEAGQLGGIGDTLARGEAVIIDDIWDSGPVARAMREALAGEPDTASGAVEKLETMLGGERSMMLVPLTLKDTIVGGLILRHKEPSYYTERHAQLAIAIANQAAIAIENARLLAESRDKARLEERQRLARELHDSVTQALFSISLIARSTEIIMQREGTQPVQVMEKLADLRQLTQGALAEMRALIFELRPGALEEVGLLEAIRKHAAATAGRERISIAVMSGQERDLPRLKPAAEEAIYRITQEALHNIVKHARASRAEVYIGATDDQIMLRVSDNGVGFDATKVPVGHMGLGTMGDRTRALAGDYKVDSLRGEGTTITVCVPLDMWLLSK